MQYSCIVIGLAFEEIEEEEILHKVEKRWEEMKIEEKLSTSRDDRVRRSGGPTQVYVMYRDDEDVMLMIGDEDDE